MGANPHANGGLLLRDLDLPDFRTTRSTSRARWADVRGHRVLGTWLRDVMTDNARPEFRIMGPDETASNRLQAVFETTGERGWRSAYRATTTSRPTAG